MPKVTHDVVLSLGVLDWLTDEELAILYEKQGRADYLHAIAEQRASIQQLIHRAYVHMAYGHRTQGYKPRYFTAHVDRRAGREERQARRLCVPQPEAQLRRADLELSDRRQDRVVT